MHVARLRISGVRGFYGARSVDLDLTRPDGSLAGWTVLAGRNGSGKSTFLQALAIALAGPRSTSFIPSLADWISIGATTAEIRATLSASDLDLRQQTLFDFSDTAPEVWIEFTRRLQPPGLDQDRAEPDFTGMGLDAFTQGQAVSSVRSTSRGWFYAGYGPFRRKYSEIVWLRAARTASTRHDAMVITGLPNTYVQAPWERRIIANQDQILKASATGRITIRRVIAFD